MADNTKCILGKNEIYLAENDNLKIIDTLVKTYTLLLIIFTIRF